MWTGPIEMEDADLSAMSPTLSTPDLERRDVATQERTKKEGPGTDDRVICWPGKDDRVSSGPGKDDCVICICHIMLE